MGKYIFAPTGPEMLISLLPKKCVELIGSMQGDGFGSNFAKGKRYLKYKVGCSGTAIKRAISTNLKLTGHDFKTYGIDVYYYHIDYCADIIHEIIMFMIDNCNDYQLKELLGECDYEEVVLLEKIYSSRVNQLKWVNDQDYTKQAEQANKLIKRFDELFM